MITFDTRPDAYKHWQLAFDGPIATLSMDVREDAGLSQDYKLKLNSYDLAVDIELADAIQRLRFEHPEVRVVVVSSLKERIYLDLSDDRKIAGLLIYTASGDSEGTLGGLVRQAEEGKLDPIVGRDKEIERVSQILSRRKKNNPILIGEPGVGKSAIAEGLALRIIQKKVSRLLFNKRVVTLDIGSMVAGTKYRGQFEERMKSLMSEMEKNPDVILFIDEIHTMVGAGGASGSLDASNMFKPALARGEIQVIGATTLDEYRKHIEKDGALERRFQKVVIEPASVEESLQILHNIRIKPYSHWLKKVIPRMKYSLNQWPKFI